MLTVFNSRIGSTIVLTTLKLNGVNLHVTYGTCPRAHNELVQNISYNVDICLDNSLFMCIRSGWNYRNAVRSSGFMLIPYLLTIFNKCDRNAMEMR